MTGKFVVAALLCFAAVHAADSDLDYVVKKALYRVQGMATAAQRQTESALREISYKKNLVQIKSSNFLDRQMRLESQTILNLERIADQLEEKAQETNRPPSVFDCIARAETNGIKRTETLGPKFETDLNRLERTKLSSIEVASRPLEELRASLEERYRRAQTEIKNCRTSTCVRQAMARITRNYDLLLSELRRIQTQVGTAANQFVRDGTNMINNYSRAVNRIQSESSRAMRNCMYGRLFEQL